MIYLSLLLFNEHSPRCFSLSQQFMSSSFVPLIQYVKVRYSLHCLQFPHHTRLEWCPELAAILKIGEH
jgi:hypothetical protein